MLLHIHRHFVQYIVSTAAAVCNSTATPIHIITRIHITHNIYMLPKSRANPLALLRLLWASFTINNQPTAIIGFRVQQCRASNPGVMVMGPPVRYRPCQRQQTRCLDKDRFVWTNKERRGAVWTQNVVWPAANESFIHFQPR